LYIQSYKHILIRLLSTLLLLYGALVFIGASSGATNVLNPLGKFTSFTSVQGVNNEIKFTYIKNIKELDEAIKNSSKAVMLDFYADWCISCKELENFTFQDERVKKILINDFLLLKADVTKNNEDDKALQKRFNIVGPPGLIFWNKNKKEIKSAKIVGYKSADDFLKTLNKVK